MAFDDDDPETVELHVDRVIAVAGSGSMLCDFGGTEVWISQQYLEGSKLQKRGDSGDIEIPEWLAEKEGLV